MDSTHQNPLDELENLVSQGLVVVLSNGSILKRGYTTGTTAAAAAKAAVLSFKKNIDMFVSQHLSGFELV